MAYQKKKNPSKHNLVKPLHPKRGQTSTIQATDVLIIMLSRGKGTQPFWKDVPKLEGVSRRVTRLIRGQEVEETCMFSMEKIERGYDSALHSGILRGGGEAAPGDTHRCVCDITRYQNC